MGVAHTFNKMSLILFHRGHTAIVEAGQARDTLPSTCIQAEDAVLTRCLCPLQEVGRHSVSKVCTSFLGEGTHSPRTEAGPAGEGIAC